MFPFTFLSFDFFMVRLTASQLSYVRARKGLFPLDVWSKCGVYVCTLALHPDPDHNPDWIHACSVVQRFMDWALEQASVRLGANARECLDLAARHDMSDELEHPLYTKPCIFSGRRRVQTCGGEPVPTIKRVQRRFHWWAAHPQTGLCVPFHSRWFVYESIYTPLLQAVHILGRFNQNLIQLGREITEHHPLLSIRERTMHNEWKGVYKNFNNIVFVVWAIVTGAI